MNLITVSRITPEQFYRVELEPGFQWRDQHGNFHEPRAMSTKHLFFTLRMIWNHSVPEPLQLKPFKHYHFSSYYTTHYMCQAVRALATELSTRKNLAPYWIESLETIRKHLHNLETLMLKEPK